jgi:hypothetical protein
LIIQGNHYYHLPKFASPECAFYGERARGGGSKGVILELIPPFNQAAAQWQHGRAGRREKGGCRNFLSFVHTPADEFLLLYT